MQLSPNKYLFHVLHSATLANLLHLPGTRVPIPTLFQHYGVFQHSMPLHLPDSPNLSLLRLLLSPHPYALKSTLVVCMLHRGALTVFRAPVITSAEFPEATIKLPSTLMMCSTEDMSDARPVSEADLKSLATPSKRVIINENKNNCVMFHPDMKIKMRGPKPHQPPTKSILKLSRSAVEELHRTTQHYHACLFYTISSHTPQPGRAPLGPFNTVMILSKSQNSINLLPNVRMCPIQRMFVKHVILQRMKLENSLAEFRALYDPHLVSIDSQARETFEAYVTQGQRALENIIFCLNSVCGACFPKRVLAAANAELLLAAEKYFLMFPPRDKPNAIPFAASIVELICKGTSLSKVLRYMAKYMDIKECVPEDNLVKAYSLLTI